jgi:hypothetical protein
MTLFVLFIIGFGCSFEPKIDRPSDSKGHDERHLNEEQVIEISVQAALAGGRAIEEYDEPRISPYYPNQWIVVFHHRARRPNESFLITIEDITGESQLISIEENP